MVSSAEPKPRTQPPTLRDLQSWLQGILMGGPGAGPSLGDPVLQHECRDLIRSGQGLDAVERVALYASGYFARLQECLHSDYPAVRAWVGDALFQQFARSYLRACPPRDYSLFRLGAGFSDYLEKTRPPEEAMAEEQRLLLSLPIDLARAERARLEALRAPSPAEPEAARRVVHPHELLWGTPLTVSTSPCSRRIELRHDVRAFLAAVDRGERPDPPSAGRMLLAISRVDYRPTMTPLRDWQGMALECCVTPRPLPELVTALAARLGEAEGAVLADLSLWLPIARQRGLLFLT